MFRENKRYQQVSLFGTLYQLSTGVKKILDKSWAPAFRKLIFEKIDEKRYAGLYSEVASRPNFPVNVWVGLEVVKGLFDYTDEELLEQFHFNLLIAYALGRMGLVSSPFASAQSITIESASSNMKQELGAIFWRRNSRELPMMPSSS